MLWKRTMCAAVVAFVCVAAAGTADARTRTTHEQTVLDCDRHNRLAPAPGERPPRR